MIVGGQRAQLSLRLSSTIMNRLTRALTWCANIFVGCSVTPTFGGSLTFLILSIIPKNKNNLYVGNFGRERP